MTSAYAIPTVAGDDGHIDAARQSPESESLSILMSVNGAVWCPAIAGRVDADADDHCSFLTTLEYLDYE